MLIIILVGEEDDEQHAEHKELIDVIVEVGGVGDQVHAALILHFILTILRSPD